jgi:glycosyltransferase involved in cell wall biosynthesis
MDKRYAYQSQGKVVKEKGFDRLLQQVEPNANFFSDYEYPKVSIVIPTFNCVQVIILTLESVLNQVYPDFEIIIIDGGSTDRTLEIIKGLRSDRIKIYSMAGTQRYEMLNKGIALSSGQYIGFLFPGDFYISRQTLKHMMTLVLEKHFPSLVFCGALIRDGKRELKILLRPLIIHYLKQGQQPTSLQSCWFKSEIFKELGKFNTSMEMRGGFDLFCRFVLSNRYKAEPTSRVLTDYDLRRVTWKMVATHFFETFRILFHYFGFFTVWKWLFLQKDFKRFFYLWLSSVKVAFLGRKAV